MIWKSIASASVIASLAAMIGCSDSSSEPGRYVVTSDNVPGCQSADTFERIQTYAAQGDKKLAAETLSKATAIGRCDLFSKGETLFLMDAGLGKAKVRRPGASKEYWVPTGHIDRQ